MKKQLYCDVDSTLNNHWVRLAKWAYPKFPSKIVLPQAFTREEVLKDLPLPQAVEGLLLLHTKYDIHILTARGYPSAYKITKDWLAQWGFVWDTINVINKAQEKPIFLKYRQCDLLIDDLSCGQEEVGSYVRLYNSIILNLQSINIPILIFKHENYWNEIITMFNGDKL